MGDDESGDDDPWFEGLRDTEKEDSETSETTASDTDPSVQSTDQWEWTPANNPESGRDAGPGDEERIWSQFGDEKTDTPAGKDSSRPGPGADGDDETTVSTEGSEITNAGTDGRTGQPDPPEGGSPTPTSTSTPAKDTDEHLSPEEDDSGGPDVPPPPPTARGRPADPDGPPGPARQDIQEMQPLYKRRSTEFYLLWLTGALSYGLGDMVTTSVVFVTPRVGESNPIVALVLDQFGLAGFLMTKLAIFGFLLAISVKGAVDDDRVSYYGPPLLAILVGIALTVWNLKTILGL